MAAPIKVALRMGRRIMRRSPETTVLRTRGFRREQVGGPVESFAAEPGRREVVAVLGQHICDGGLVGLRRCRREGERDLAQAKLKQAIAAT